MLNQEWGNVDDVIHKMQRYPLHVHGDGFCFIYSLMESLSHDHKITLEFNQIHQLILIISVMKMTSTSTSIQRDLRILLSQHQI